MGEKKNGKQCYLTDIAENMKKNQISLLRMETQDTHKSKWEEIPQAPLSVEAAKTLIFKSYECQKKHKYLVFVESGAASSTPYHESTNSKDTSYADFRKKPANPNSSASPREQS